MRKVLLVLAMLVLAVVLSGCNDDLAGQASRLASKSNVISKSDFFTMYGLYQDSALTFTKEGGKYCFEKSTRRGATTPAEDSESFTVATAENPDRKVSAGERLNDALSENAANYVGALKILDTFMVHNNVEVKFKYIWLLECQEDGLYCDCVTQDDCDAYNNPELYYCVERDRNFPELGKMCTMSCGSGYDDYCDESTPVNNLGDVFSCAQQPESGDPVSVCILNK